MLNILEKLFRRQPKNETAIITTEPVEVRVGREYIEDSSHGFLFVFPSRQSFTNFSEIIATTDDPAIVGHALLCASRHGDITIQTRFPDGTRAMDLTYIARRRYHFDTIQNTWIILE